MTNSKWAKSILQIMLNKNKPIKLLTGPTGWVWIDELWEYQYFYGGVFIGEYVSRVSLNTLQTGGIYYTQKGSTK